MFLALDVSAPALQASPYHQGQAASSCRLPGGTVVADEVDLFHPEADAQVSGCWRC